LQRVVVAERLLDGVQRPVGSGQAFYGHDVAAIGLYGEHRAGFDAVPVEMNGARAAVAGVAAHHRPALAEPVTEVVHEQKPRLHLVGISRSIDGDSDAHRPTLLWLVATNGRNGETGSAPVVIRRGGSRRVAAAASRGCVRRATDR